ncbi:thioredoxin domain-containing protein [Ferruginibacter paludis]|uniref:thioredoxin domain-containing protein n=1 Tax=Ferruginibacter paludis TaxID=1310417 RepID=UPI0025B572CC|nr:thioredoxin domain-containing protein [Ferruginibacter paludis]MDN3658585.1 thioredoxin domain-containing protein [Ferruginibacter paludis]
MSHAFTNSLIKETSPYLLQHAHNPVNWYAWGEEALQKAKAEDKVILASIGYSACHWCHVMEKESFENVTIAALMNENFINIKIDREERPDLDHIYMDAVQAIAGSGGWPLNVFLTPDGKPFYGGTYYPPVRAFNRSSWPEVLQGIAAAWQEKRDEIESQAENLIAHLNRSGNFTQTATSSISSNDERLFSMDNCHQMFKNIMATADKEWGGFGKAPKFPQTFIIQFLLQYQHFTGNKEALQQALLSLDKMLDGGIYDHIAGGMARYSTDNEWLVPHFEKMLYDNALLIDALCDAWQITKCDKYRNAILKTIGFIQSELTNDEGGFFAALDADSEGVEGKYYVWTKTEIDEVLKENAAIFCEFFDVTEKGNWEDANILRILEPIYDFVTRKNLDEHTLTELLQSCLHKLAAVRAGRIKPSLDDKIILGWNALALKAIAKAAFILEDETLRMLALKNFAFIETNFIKTAGSYEMHHTFKSGVAKYPAFLDDYAFFIAACFEMYSLTYDTEFLQKAKNLTCFVVDSFSDGENNCFFYTPKNQTDVIIRKKEIYDGALPSGNSVMAANLFKLSRIFNIPDWKYTSIQMLIINSEATIKYPSSFAVWASFLLQNVVGFNELAIIGRDCFQLSRKVANYYIPYKIMMASTLSNDEFLPLKSKPASIQSLIYLCKNNICFKPEEQIDGILLYLNES